MARWSVNDDEYLWDHRDDPVKTSATKFSRTRTSIRNRLENLREPTHAAFKRLFGNNPPSNNNSNKLIKRRPIKPQTKPSNNIESDNLDNDSSSSSDNSDGEVGHKKKKKKRKKKKKGKNKWRKKQSGKKWSIEDDIYLWTYRDDTVQILADTFERTRTAIKCRLEILRDPHSKWRKRLLLNLPKDDKKNDKPLIFINPVQLLDNTYNSNNKEEIIQKVNMQLNIKQNAQQNIQANVQQNIQANIAQNIQHVPQNVQPQSMMQYQNIQQQPMMQYQNIQQQPMMQYQNINYQQLPLPQQFPPQHTYGSYNYIQPMQYQMPNNMYNNMNNNMYNNMSNNMYSMYSNNGMQIQYPYQQLQHQSQFIPMQSQHIQQNIQQVPNVNMNGNNNGVKRVLHGNDIGHDEPLRKKQKIDDNVLIIPSQVVEQQNKSQPLQIEDFKQRMRAEKFKKNVNEIVNNPYYIGQNIQIKDSQSLSWINAIVIDKENNWIVVHFDGCSSIYDQQIHVIKNQNKIRSVGSNVNDTGKNEEEEEAPDEFCDPITFEPMKEPTLVIVSGVTYEKSVIEEYIKENGQDPMTRQPVKIDQLVPNRALRDTIERWMKNHPGVIN